MVRVGATPGDPGESLVLKAGRRILRDPLIARLLARVLPGKLLPVLTAYGLACGALAVMHRFVVGTSDLLNAAVTGDLLAALLFLVACTAGLVGTALATLALLVNAQELMMMAFARKDLQLDVGKLPVEEARFFAMSLRGRRAFATQVTFRTDRLPPSTRVGMEVRVFDEQGKPLPGQLPKYQARDGEFLSRDLSGPIGQSDDFRFSMGSLLPVLAIGLPRRPDEMIYLRAEVALKIDGVVHARQSLTTSFRARESDYPAPLKPRDGEPTAPASAEEIAFTGGVSAAHGGCPVCGDRLEGAVVACEECQVPHHSECWNFAGRCSTYGCQGDPTAALDIVAAAGDPAASETRP